MNKQLTLAIQPRDEAALSNFCWGSNRLLQQELASMLAHQGEKFLYLWGNTGSGKSHLLQACCQAFNTTESAIYLPLHLLKPWGAESIEDLDEQCLICVDDIDAIAENPVWEEALFHLYNRIKDKEQGLCIISGSQPPAAIPIQLPDLRSRLGWGLVMQLQDLQDEEKIQALQQHALLRGFELPPTVAQFLITRCSRNMHHLYQLLIRLDEASLAAHRKITVPFVKRVLGI